MNEIKSLLSTLRESVENSESNEERLKEYEKEKIKSKKKEIEEQILTIYGRRNVGNTFENFRAETLEQEEIKKACENYAKMEKSHGESLLLIGPPGTGKTHLSISVLKEANRSFKAVKIEYLAEIKRACQNGTKLWYWKMKDYCETPLLLIDDVGVRGEFTNSMRETFFYILDQRYNNYLPLIINSNWDMKDILRNVDSEGLPRAKDRMISMFGKRVLTMNWESQRGFIE